MSSYQRFVNTTPKPRAMKKRRGELLPPPRLSELSLLWLVPGGLEDWGLWMLAVVVEVTGGSDSVSVALATRRAAAPRLRFKASMAGASESSRRARRLSRLTQCLAQDEHGWCHGEAFVSSGRKRVRGKRCGFAVCRRSTRGLCVHPRRCGRATRRRTKAALERASSRMVDCERQQRVAG